MKKFGILMLFVLLSATVFAQRYRSGYNTTKISADKFAIVSFNQNEKFYVVPPYIHKDKMLFATVAYLQVNFTDKTMVMIPSRENVKGEFMGMKFEPSNIHHKALSEKVVDSYVINVKHDGSQIKFKPTDSRYFIKQYNLF